MTTSAATDVLLERARAWAAEDPDDATRAELEQIIADVEGGADSADLADRFAGTLEFGTAGLRGAVGAGSEPDEPGRRDPRRRRAGGVPAGAGRDRPGRGRVRRAAPQRRLRPRHRRGDVGRRLQGLGDAAAAADAGAGVRDPRARLRGRRDGHREPQPAPGQRLQGLPRRRQPDRAAGGRRDRGPDRRGRRAGATCPAAPAGPCSASTSSTATSTRSPSSPRTGRATSTSSTRRCTASAARRCCRCSRPPASARRGWSSSRSSRTPTSRPSRSPTRRSRARWTSRMALAAEHDADLVVANDPDADRCAAAVPTGHGWRMLRGDEVGALLAHHLMSRGRTGTWATSIVSSSLLGRMAAAAGQPYVETLTGFKWIGRVAGLAFGYEEALGYCCDPDHVKDKDGVSALLLLCELAAADQGGRAAPWSTSSTTSRCSTACTPPTRSRCGSPTCRSIAAAMERLRAAPPSRARRPRGRAGRRPRARQRRPAAHRRAAVPPRRRRPGRRPPERHRAQAQVLPRGGRPGGRRGRRRRGPDLGRGPAGRARRGRGGGARALALGVSSSREDSQPPRATAITKKTAVATSAAISGQASSRRTCLASSSASGE